MPLDRRSFVQLSLSAAVGSQVPAPAPVLAANPLRTPHYAQTTINAGIPQTQQQNTLAILDTFDDDALLKPFRAMGNQPAPGRDIGGWYQYLPDYNWHTGDAGFAPGHCFGQWTSALARSAAAQNEASAANRVTHLQALLGGAITPDFFDKTRFPAYTLDKLHCGLLDAHTLLRSPNAFAVLDKVHRCALPSLPPAALDRENHSTWRKDRDQSWGWDESYTLPENLYLLYAAGAGDQYRAMARSYLLDSFFDPLSRNQNVLGGLHGYSHVNALCSAMQAWFIDDSQMHLDAARNGYRMIEAQSYATGGWAPDELFEKPGSGKLLASLTSTHNSFETPCGNYAFLKLSRYLLQVTRDGHYGDRMERLLWNTMFGALSLQPDGRTFYYQDTGNIGRRIYSAHRWPCCAGTYTQVAADYGINTFLLGPEDEGSVWVNLYLPSTLRWSLRGAHLQLTQIGDATAVHHVQLHLKTTQPTTFPLCLRIPGWCSSPSLHLNDKPAHLRSDQGFILMNRTWRDGDRVDLYLPAALRLEPFPTDGSAPQESLAALCWGPWVLLPLAPSPTARTEDLLRAERIASTEWLVRRPEGDLYLRPFFAVGDGSYATYMRLTEKRIQLPWRTRCTTLPETP